MDIDEEIKKIEEEIKNTKYNKATQHHIGKLKAKIACLRDKKLKQKGGKGGAGFGVKKSGDATIGIVGFPSVGKSTLINRLTNAESKIGSYDFTTTSVIPGVMEYGGCKIQILDLPGIIYGASEGKGEGRRIISIARAADLLLIMVDAGDLSQLDFIRNELWLSGIRINQKPPNVTIKKKDRGGISIELSRKAKIDCETAKNIAQEYLINADIVIRENVDEERLIDALSGNRVYIPSIVAINKIDMSRKGKINIARDDRTVLISAKTGFGIEELKEKIFNTLTLVRVYMKPEGKGADMKHPLVLKKGAKIEDVCRKIHREFVKNFRYAAVWGPSASFPGQRVGMNHKVEDGDIITIATR
ncbi:MAG: GTPase [Candidatus Thermoplasmatota archaeon]|nr:GTPase [Candidatus Thermoplasmatota archaeon]